jgi:hypothetical protein
MIKNTKKPGNLAGMMGQKSAQPAQMSGQSTVDPLERLNQKMAGRTQGGSTRGLKMRKPSLMNSYGMR